MPSSLVGYSRLVMFSFGFQQAFQRGFERGDQVFFIKVSVYVVSPSSLDSHCASAWMLLNLSLKI